MGQSRLIRTCTTALIAAAVLFGTVSNALVGSHAAHYADTTALDESPVALYSNTSALDGGPVALYAGTSALDGGPVALYAGTSALDESPVALYAGTTALDGGSSVVNACPPGLTARSAEEQGAYTINNNNSQIADAISFVPTNGTIQTTVPGMQNAAASALIEASTGKLLLKSNCDAHLPMASTTKTMTALVVLENCALDDIVEIPREAQGVEGSSMYLKAGEKLSVEDLLYGLMLLSGNDAAVALAIHVGGSVEGFVDMMNDRAERLGLQDTHFVTPNGLHDDEHYTTAYELALIGAEALKNESFRTIVSTQYHSASTGSTARTMKNKNSLLWDYDGALGIKTGYTMAAGRCLLFAAERDGMTLVGTVMNCRPMFEVASEMLDYGFANYSMCKAVDSGAEIARCLVPNGEKSLLALVAEHDIIIPVRKGTELQIEVRVSLQGDVLPPIVQGEHIGRAEFYSGGEKIGETALNAAESIASRSFKFYLDLLIRALMGG